MDINYSTIVEAYNSEDYGHLDFCREIVKSFTAEQNLELIQALKDDGWELDWKETHPTPSHKTHYHSLWIYKDNRWSNNVRFVFCEQGFTKEQILNIFP